MLDGCCDMFSWGPCLVDAHNHLSLIIPMLYLLIQGCRWDDHFITHRLVPRLPYLCRRGQHQSPPPAWVCDRIIWCTSSFRDDELILQACLPRIQLPDESPVLLVFLASFSPSISLESIVCTENCMQFCWKMHAHAIFLLSKHSMMGVYQLVWTSVMMSQELMNKIQLWNRFSFVFTKVVFSSRVLTPKLWTKIRESCNTYSHGILSWEKWFSTKSEKWLVLLIHP